MNKKVCLAVLICMLLTATFGAAAAAKNNTTCRNNRIEFCSEDVMHPLIEPGISDLLKIQQLNMPPFEIGMSKVGEILKIFVLSSLLGFSFVMAKRSNLEF